MKQAFVDYYAVLGVDTLATAEEIRSAYRKLAVQHHPDKQGDPARFSEINEANGVLGDREKREAYDFKRANRLVENIAEAAESVVDEYFQQF
jgi:curved DNA-binding protein